MIPTNDLLGIYRDLVLQNDEGSLLGSSTAVFVSDWANKQFQKAGEAASSPGSFIGIIHYAGTNVQGGLIAATVADGDWAKVTTHGVTYHNYQRRVETTWSEGDTLYLAMGVAQDGLLTNSPGSSTEIIEVGKCLVDAGSNEDALIELSGWRSSLRIKDAPVDTDAIKITIVGGTGGDASASNGGAGSSVTVVAGTGGTSASSFDGGNGGVFSITSGTGGDTDSGDAGSGGNALIVIGNGGDAGSGGSPGDGGSFSITIGDGGDGPDGSGVGGSYTVNVGDGGDTSSSGDGGNGGSITYNIGVGGTSASGTGGIGGAFNIYSGAGGLSSSGAGGASGSVGLTIGNGGVGTTTGGAAGSITFTGGVGGSAPTAGDGSSITLTSGAGGSNATDTAPRTAGDSGSISFTSGVGGNDTTATGGTGGNSGAVNFESGNAGASTYGTAGNSGDVTLKAGQGGASTSGNAGDGGTTYIRGGAGGYHATASNSYIPGDAGNVSIKAGKGGFGSTTQIGTAGGNILIVGGDGGDDRGAGDGDGGDVTLDGGAGDTNGVVSIGETNASAINSGSGSTVFTHDGNLVVTGTITGAPSLPNGEMYISANASATTLSQTPTYTRITSTYNSGILNDFTLTNGSGGSAGALRYDGATTRTFKVTAGVSAGASAADTILFRIAKNGTTEAKSETRRYMSASNDEGSTIVTCHVSLATNDYVEIFASRVGATANITVDYMNFNISTV